MPCGPGTIRLAFDRANPRATAWLESQSAKLISQMDHEAKMAIRSMLVRGAVERIPTRVTAKLIRASIGLTERQANAVMNRHLKLLANGIPSKLATARAEKYASQLLTRRANLIAYQETMNAAAEGQRELWRQAGLPDTVRKRLVQWDPCPVCSPMADEVVGVNESFSGGLPPFHVRCRCVEGLVN